MGQRYLLAPRFVSAPAKVHVPCSHGDVCADKQAPSDQEVPFAVTDDPPRYAPDEKFSLHPLDPEEGLRRLLRRDDDPDADEVSEAEEL